jgi:hypothetical protein
MKRSFLCLIAACLCTTSSAAVAFPDRVRKVLIIGVDGMRPDAMTAANTPHFDALIASGAVSYQCSAEDITVSGPGWSSILTGVHRDKHLVTNNNFAPQNYIQYPHFFSRLRSLCQISTASIVHWAPVNTQILKGEADVIETGLSDAGVAAAAAALMEAASPDVTFLHFDDVDHAGHTFGFSPTVPGYIAAIETTDSYAGEVLAAITTRPSYPNEDWLIIVTSDHGGTPDGSHGQNIPEHRLTGLIVSGPSTAIGSLITPAPQIVDLPATVFAFLGLPVNSAWNWDGHAVGLNMPASTSIPFDCIPPEPPSVGACCLLNGSCVVVTAPQCLELRGQFAGINTLCSDASCDIPVIAFAETFDSVPLGPNLNETVSNPAAWSPTPPSGWTADRSGVPTGGVTEWRGWSMASPTWWTQIAGDQGRSGFTRASGNIAVADPDEWDDLAHATGTYNTTLTTPTISLSGLRAQSVRLLVDSSWLPSGNQTAALIARYDGGSPVTLFTWTSQPGPTFKPDALNETLDINLNAPPGTASVQLSFALTNAGNDWWWAIDNLQVVAEPLSERRLLLLEDFDAVPLGPNVDETLAADRVWSGTPPTGWQFDDSGVPGVNNPAVGVTEWKGWAIADRLWWTSAAADQRRSEFVRGVGAVAVADPDEWDDRGAPSALGPYNAIMTTPQIPLVGVLRSSLALDFDSSWRPEGLQRAELTAIFDVGAPVPLLVWNSAAGPAFKPDAPNEHVSFTISTPPGASNVRLRFALLDARNNWWWAVDNIALTGDLPSCPADLDDGSGVGIPDGGVDINDLLYFLAAFEAGNAHADLDNDGDPSIGTPDGGVDINDLLFFLARFQSGC